MHNTENMEWKVPIQFWKNEIVFELNHSLIKLEVFMN